jgi:hypothetical protein
MATAFINRGGHVLGTVRYDRPGGEVLTRQPDRVPEEHAATRDDLF